MNVWQAAHQLKYLLDASVWSDPPTERVFGAVRVTPVVDDRVLLDLRFPLVLIDPGDESPDADEGMIEDVSFELTLIQAAEGQDPAVAALMGGPRSRGAGSSLGRGVLELQEPLKAAVARLTGADGMRAVCRYRGASAAQEMAGMGYVVARRYRVEVSAHAVRHYEAPRYVKATGGAGQVALTWTAPPSRWDFHGLVLRRAAGSTAPATPQAGTDVPVDPTATSITVTGLAAGAHSFALFAAYDETGSQGPERYSDQEADTIDSATVT